MQNGVCVLSSEVSLGEKREREGEGERPRSRVLENVQMRIRTSVDAGVLASSISALT